MTRKSFLKFGLITPVLAMLPSCEEKEPELALPIRGEAVRNGAFLPRRIYGFRHAETTGVTSFLVTDKREQAIQFADDSDKEALVRLNGLRAHIFLALTDGNHLFVVGEISRNEFHTPGGANRAASEAFRYFRLKEWYVVPPFYEWEDVAGEEQPRRVIHTELRGTDFNAPLSYHPRFSPHRYQKSRVEHLRYATHFPRG